MGAEEVAVWNAEDEDFDEVEEKFVPFNLGDDWICEGGGKTAVEDDATLLPLVLPSRPPLPSPLYGCCVNAKGALLGPIALGAFAVFALTSSSVRRITSAISGKYGTLNLILARWRLK